MSNQYSPKLYNSSQTVELSSGQEITIVDEEYEGQLSEIRIRVQDKYTEVSLEIDGAEEYRLDLGDLENEYGLTEEEHMSIGVTNNGKKFFDIYNYPCSFRNSIKIKIKNVDNNSKDLYSYFVRLRKKI